MHLYIYRIDFISHIKIHMRVFDTWFDFYENLQPPPPLPSLHFTILYIISRVFLPYIIYYFSIILFCTVGGRLEF
jgi:hypothetical protein